MKKVLAAMFLLAACDANETVYIPLDGYPPYKERVTRDVCAMFPPGAKTTRETPQFDIIHAKCKELGYPISTRPDPNYSPPCNPPDENGRRIPAGYHSCNF